MSKKPSREAALFAEIQREQWSDFQRQMQPYGGPWGAVVGGVMGRLLGAQLDHATGMYEASLGQPKREKRAESCQGCGAPLQWQGLTAINFGRTTVERYAKCSYCTREHHA